MYAVNMNTFQSKGLEQVNQEAKDCFTAKNENMKLEKKQQSDKFGKVKLVFPEVAQEIKKEFRIKSAQRQCKEGTIFEDLSFPFRRQFAQDAISKLTRALASSHFINNDNRRVVPTIGE